MPDDVLDDRQVELAERPTTNDVDLRRGDPIDVGNLAKDTTVEPADLRPDHLVPVRRTRLEVRIAVDLRLQVRLAEALGRGPVRDLAELQAPTRPILDRGRGNDGERRTRPLAMEDAPGRKPILGPVGQDLQPDDPMKPVKPPDTADDEPRARGGR